LAAATFLVERETLPFLAEKLDWLVRNAGDSILKDGQSSEIKNLAEVLDYRVDEGHRAPKDGETTEAWLQRCVVSKAQIEQALSC
jgi:hypothetical protein